MLAGQIVVVSACLYLCFGATPFLSKCTDHGRCKEKITIMKTLAGQSRKKTEYIKIQRVVDKESGRTFTLINPLIVKFLSHQPRLIYPLKLLKLVNNKLYETFFHKDNSADYHECDDNTLNQLCGKDMKGFCCHCDDLDENFPYHIRGGQECIMNSSSAHCLRYDTLWYSLNELMEQKFHHMVLLSIVNMGNNKVSRITVGSSTPTSDKVMISVRYNVNHTTQDILNYKENILLIPLSSDKNISQLMLFNRSLISKNGEECNKIGVSVKAFNKQPNRCRKHSQSCLDNQPMQFWLEDMERKLRRQQRNFVLEDIITGVPNIVKSELSQWSLAVPITDVNVSLSIEIQADDIEMVPKQFKQIIREVVYVDNNHTETLFILLFNQGYLQETVELYLRDCNVNITGNLAKRVQLMPHKTEHIEISFHSEIISGTFRCKVSVLGENDEDEWKITLQKQHSCICYPDISCNCGDHGYYRLPFPSTRGIFRGPTDPLFILCIIMVILFFIGLTKALISLVSPVTIGELGLCLFTRSRVLSSYHEQILAKYDVVYNEKGIPVHPVTKRPVRILPKTELFILNLCFGYYVLFIGVHWLALKIFGLDVKYQHEREEKSWHQKLVTPLTSPTESSKYVGLINGSYIDKYGADTETNKNAYGVTDKQLVYEQYRKQKKELVRCLQMKNSVTERGDESPRKRSKSRSLKVRAKSLNRKLPIEDLIELDHVFFNYQRESPLLKKSGKCFSLCGILSRHGRRFKFELGPYSVQMCQNIDGAPQKLTTPQKIVHPIKFTAEMNTSAVHQYITTKPMFPCLNTSYTSSCG